jgi:hypothetical protein
MRMRMPPLLPCFLICCALLIPGLLPAQNTRLIVKVGTTFTASGGATITNTNLSNTSNILHVTTNGPGVIADHSLGNAGTAGVYGMASGTGGYAGYFEHTETTGYGITLQVVSRDQGYAMVVDHEGTGDERGKRGQ